MFGPIVQYLKAPQVSNPFLFLLYWLFQLPAKDIMKASCSCCDLLLYSICRQNTAEGKDHCLSVHFGFQNTYSPQRKLLSFPEQNGGMNVYDDEVLTWRNVFIASRKSSRASAILFISVRLWSSLSEMDRGVVVCSLAQVCSFLVNIAAVFQRQLSPRH